MRLLKFEIFIFLSKSVFLSTNKCMDYNLQQSSNGSVYLFEYPCQNNDCEPYSALFPSGEFRIECWGASGGNNIGYGGKGAYTSGVLSLNSPTVLYFYIGNSGIANGGRTYNGGGKGASQSGSGGGATDIRYVGGNFSNFLSLKSRIMVAGGGGGGSNHGSATAKGGDGGKLFGQSGSYAQSMTDGAVYQVPAAGGTQIEGGRGGYSNVEGVNATDGQFGFGGEHVSITYPGGGGSGYYGGGGGTVTTHRVGSGAGGSSYVSGYPGCNSISNLSTNSSIVHLNISNHFSGYVFSNPIIYDSSSSFPSPLGGVENGHTGYGYVRITILSNTIEEYHNNYNNYHIYTQYEPICLFPSQLILHSLIITATLLVYIQI